MSQRNSFLDPMIEVRKHIAVADSGDKKKKHQSEESTNFARNDSGDASVTDGFYG